ncbi:MAG: GNAT family N-acetyltransferase [Vicinamibacteria bacterium]
MTAAGPGLTTERLRLRLPRAEDGAFLVRLMNDPDWLRHIGDRDVRSEQAAAAYVAQRMLPSFREHAFGMFVVETIAGGEAVGICGLVKRPTLADCDLGFAFLTEQRGRGYAVEAGAAVLADARERLKLARVLAITTPDNQASARVLERLGMAFAGERTLDGDRALRLYEWSAGRAPNDRSPALT